MCIPAFPLAASAGVDEVLTYTTRMVRRMAGCQAAEGMGTGVLARAHAVRDPAVAESAAPPTTSLPVEREAIALVPVTEVREIGVMASVPVGGKEEAIRRQEGQTRVVGKQAAMLTMPLVLPLQPRRRRWQRTDGQIPIARMRRKMEGAGQEIRVEGR